MYGQAGGAYQATLGVPFLRTFQSVCLACLTGHGGEQRWRATKRGNYLNVRRKDTACTVNDSILDDEGVVSG
jgi:hypothetical protein